MLTKEQINNLQKIIEDDKYSKFIQILIDAKQQWEENEIEPIFEDFGNIRLLTIKNCEKYSIKYSITDYISKQTCLIGACLIDKYLIENRNINEDFLLDINVDDIDTAGVDFDINAATIFNLSKYQINAIICGYDDKPEKFKDLQEYSNHLLVLEYEFGNSIRNALLAKNLNQI